MEAVISNLEWILILVEGKPFSLIFKILSGIVAAATLVTVLHSGFIWTILFAALFTFFGAATFLLIADDQNGGIIRELKKLLISFQSPFLEKFLQLFPQVPAPPNHPTQLETASLQIVGSVPKPTTLLTSSGLERIYPWLNLTIPKILDDSLTNFLEIIINDYITKDWYALVQVRKNFVNETRVALRFCVSRLFRRISTINFTNFVQKKISRTFVEHLSVYLSLRKLSAESGETDIEVLLKKHPELSHYAMKESSDESHEDLFYYRISTKILRHILPREFRRFQASAAVLREVLSEMVLKMVVDVFSEPHRINYLISLMLCPPAHWDSTPTNDTDQTNPTKTTETNPIETNSTNLGETNSIGLGATDLGETDSGELDETNLSQVSILRNLVNEEKPTSTIQKIPFRQILKETILKNSFEQHLKSLGLEDFSKIHESISWINKFLDSPVLGEAAMLSTFNSLLKLQKDLQIAEEKNYNFPADFLSDIRAISVAGPSAIPKLRHLPSWKNLNDQLVSLFENLLVPAFQETRLYHHLLIPPTEEISRKRLLQRGTSRPRPADPEKFRMLREKVQVVLKDVPPVVDRQDSEFYEDFDGSIGLPDDDFDDLDNDVPTTNEDVLGSTLRDLSYYEVSVLRAERRRDDRGRIFMILNITILDRGPLSPDLNKRWAVQRKYSEFYILDSKIREFHGTLEASSYLPAKKAWSQPSLDFLQHRVGDFERFLQLLVREPKLRYSQMLYNFLATTMEFDSSGFPDLGLGKVIRNVPQILTQERGQNIESFIRSLLNVALPGKTKSLNESPLPREATPISVAPPPRYHFESIPFDSTNSENEISEKKEIFDEIENSENEKKSNLEKNSNLEKKEISDDFGKRKKIENVFDEIIFLATKFLKTDPELISLVASCHGLVAPLVEEFSRKKIEEFLEFVKNPKQISFFLDVLSETLKTNNSSPENFEIDQQKTATLETFLSLARTSWAKILCGKNSEKIARIFFDFFQYKILNKRLVMIFLDLIVVELFPELEASDAPLLTPL